MIPFIIAAAVLITFLWARADIYYFLYHWRVDRYRRRYLTAAERRELREQRTRERYGYDWEREQRLLHERESKRSKFRPELLIDAESLIGEPRGLMELSATQLVAEFRQAIIWRRMAETACTAHTGSGCLDGFPVVRQWREQTDALEAEYDRRTSDPVRRGLSWRERWTLHQAGYEFGDFHAQHLPLPLHTARDRDVLLASFATDEDPDTALYLTSIDTTEE
ncbi:hypothetical protein JK358_34310 [Nocardia sp. 2]|uniref:Uncharacterized protein n=1 Tax=Nocardia acididurans TaxID=2802282 RepID=A0ABS1MG05_9NOCA|nr:hypothetical protein [Nocardia acididurans]MBL1079492.1 hypothetical protein [Nocardia acididurans]